MESTQKIARPNVSIENVKEILQSFYNVNVDKSKIFELNAYDDRNYWINLSENGSSDVILKITNKEDSKNLEMINAQTNLLKYLSEKGFMCPEPIKSSKGLFFPYKFQDTLHVVRLFKFIPGLVLDKAPKVNKLYYDVGQGIGQLNLAMQDFDNAVYKNHSHKWMLENCCNIREYLNIITDVNKKDMIERILNRFENNVLSLKSTFKQGLIHGDYNENNIIVKKINEKEYKIHGVIDFGDVNYSFIIFDLAIAITYMLIHSGNITTGKYVLSGYKSVRKDITIAEKNILNICVQARLCQSLVNGAFAFSQDPGNEYLLSSQKTGWIILEQLYNMSNEEVLKIWDDTD